MRTLLPFIFLLGSLAYIGCGTSDNKKADEEEVVYESVTDSADIVTPGDSLRTVVNEPTLWKVESLGDQQEEKLTGPKDSILESFTPNQLVVALNETYPEIQIKFQDISHDTMFVSIPNSKVLTEQMGSTGSYNYLATAVFNLTELKNVKYIHFDFKEGDHASPGTFTRKDFDRLR